MLNGSENEGLGDSQDADFVRWSTGINLLNYSQNRTSRPQFKYIVHKNAPGASSARLIMATSQALEAAFANVQNPITNMFSSCTPAQWDALYNRSGFVVLDEMVGGTSRKRHWLGKPIEGLRRPAVNSVAVHPNNISDLRSLIVPPSNGTVSIVHQNNQTVITPSNSTGAEFNVSLPGLRTTINRDFTLSFEIASLGDLDGHTGDPAMPRIVKGIPSAAVMPAEDSSRLRKTQNGLFGRNWSQVVFYYRNEQAQDFQFDLTFEGTQPLAIRNLKLTHAPDILIRRFENGIVIANPSYREYSLNLGALYPGKIFKRLTATPCQATDYNDGRIEGTTVIIPPKDGLFLINGN